MLILLENDFDNLKLDYTSNNLYAQGNLYSILYILPLDNSTDTIIIHPPNLIKILIYIAFKRMH